MKVFSFTTDPDQQFGAILNGQRVTLRFRWNSFSNRWSMDLSRDDLPVLQGIRVVTGTNLLASFDFDLGVMFALADKVGAEPGREELADGRVKLYHATDEEVTQVSE